MKCFLNNYSIEETDNHLQEKRATANRHNTGCSGSFSFKIPCQRIVGFTRKTTGDRKQDNKEVALFPKNNLTRLV